MNCRGFDEWVEMEFIVVKRQSNGSSVKQGESLSKSLNLLEFSFLSFKCGC